MPDAPPAVDRDARQIAELLVDCYELDAIELVRLPIGQGAVNYQATRADRTLFIKHYPANTNLVVEAEAIMMTQLAGAPRCSRRYGGALPHR